MKRREFIAALGGAAAAASWPLGANAQQSNKLRRIGMLMAYADGDREDRYDRCPARPTAPGPVKAAMISHLSAFGLERAKDWCAVFPI